MSAMDVSTDTVFETIAPVGGFTLDVAADRSASYDTLLYKGRRVTEVEARVVEAQFRLPNGSTLVLLNEDEPFKEMLTLILVGPNLKVLDRKMLGGATTPGYLIYAYPAGPNEVAFCWHDLEQVVTIRQFPRWFGLRSGWLQVREVGVQAPRAARAALQPVRTRQVKARAIPALAWLAWLQLRTVRLRSKQPGYGRAPLW